MDANLKNVKKRLIKKYGAICYYCLKRLDTSKNPKHKDDIPTLDHYIPLSKGGTNHKNNLVLCCFECNQKKKSDLWLHVPAPTNKHRKMRRRRNFKHGL